jgi:hypothetical protein
MNAPPRNGRGQNRRLQGEDKVSILEKTNEYQTKPLTQDI